MTEREAMTLEQVRDFCRTQSKQFGYWYEQRQFEKMADAIDAHLSRAAEPVRFFMPLRLFESVKANFRLGNAATADVFSEPHNPDDVVLYTHPPEPARDAKDAEIAHLREVLGDLLSWFPAKPSSPEWRIEAGERGADEAIEAARAAMAQESGE